MKTKDEYINLIIEDINNDSSSFKSIIDEDIDNLKTKSGSKIIAYFSLLFLLLILIGIECLLGFFDTLVALLLNAFLLFYALKHLFENIDVDKNIEWLKENAFNDASKEIGFNEFQSVLEKAKANNDLLTYIKKHDSLSSIEFNAIQQYLNEKAISLLKSTEKKEY